LRHGRELSGRLGDGMQGRVWAVGGSGHPIP